MSKYDDYMTTAETAEFLKVSKRTVEKWRAKGWLMPDVIGHDRRGRRGAYYYSKEHVLQLASVYRKKNCNQTATTSATDNAVDIWEDEEEDDDTVASLPVFFPADDDANDDDELIDPPIIDTATDVPAVDAAKAQTSALSGNDDRQARIDEAERFFDALFGKIPAGHFSYLIKFSGGTDTYTFELANETQLLAMAQKAVELSDKGVDIWHAVNPVCVKPHYEFDEAKQKNVFKRGDETVVSYQTAVVVDIDIRSDAHKGDPSKLAANFDEAKSFLPFPPSILIDSGYGLHAYYIFDTPLVITDSNREEIKRRNKLLLDVIRAKANGKTIDPVEDLPRILRTPATFNYKLGKDNAPMCHVVEVNDIRFTPADLDERLAALQLAPIQISPQSIPIQIPTKPARHTDVDYDDDNPDLKEFRIRRMLDCISVVKGEYEKWLDVGFALYNEGLTCADWEQWSRTQPEFKEGECESKWTGFSYRTDGITIGSLYQWAVEGGYDEKETQRDWYRQHPEFSKKKSSSAQIEELKEALREVNKALADFDTEKDAALEKLRSIETFDSDTVFSDEIVTAGAFAYIFDKQSYSNLRREIKLYGDKYPSKKAGVNEWIAQVKGKAEEISRRREQMATRRNGIQTKIKTLKFVAVNDILAKIEIPTGYGISENGIEKDAGENSITVCRRPVIITGTTYNVNDDIHKVELSYMTQAGIWKKIPPTEKAIVFNNRRLIDLANANLPVTSSNAALLVDFLDAFNALNENILPTTYNVNRCGWHNFFGRDYFIDPRRDCVIQDEDKNITVKVDSRSEFAKHLKQVGSLEEWKKAYLLAKKSPVARLIVAAAVAAPLLKILGERNFLLYICAPTRAGKTTALYLGASAVGSEKIIRSFDATKNGLAGAAADVNDYAFLVDEKQVADNRLKEAFDNLVYALANGIGRTKLNKDSTLKKLQDWRTVAIMTGETQPLADNVTGGANTRLLVIKAPKEILPAADCKFIRDIIKENSGLVFPLVVDKAKELGKETLKSLFDEAQATFAEKAPDLLEEYRRYMAVLSIADMLLNSSIGVNSIEAKDGRKIKSLDDAIATNAVKIFPLIPTTDEIDDTPREKEFVCSFIAQNQTCFIGGTKEAKYMQVIYGKLLAEDGFTYITVQALKDACAGGGFDYRKLVADLVAVGFFIPADSTEKRRKTPLATVQKQIGTTYARCYRISNSAFEASE